MRARFRPTALLGCAALAAGCLAVAGAAGAAPAAPCTPRIGAVGGRSAIVYCGPATVELALGRRTYVFRGGLCENSRMLGGLELEVGTLVQHAVGNAGRPFVSLMIAASPSTSEALDADAGGRRLFDETVIAPSRPPFEKGTFTSVLGPAFSGSWDCHDVIYAAP